MSSLIDKAFDATQKIIRSIFRGSPNLFTTADLNRQLELITYQLNSLEERVGVVSDMYVTATTISSGNTLVVQGDFSYLIVRGCDFTGDFPSGTISVTKARTSEDIVFFLCLTAQSQVVTYSDNPSHDISGAKFADGTSRSAADTLVYTNPTLVVVKESELASLSNKIGIIAVLTVQTNGRVSVTSNCMARNTSLASQEMRVTATDPTVKASAIGLGSLFQEALLRINSIFYGRTNGSAGTFDWNTIGNAPFTLKFAVSNGCFRVASAAADFSLEAPSGFTGAPTYIAFYGFSNGALNDYFTRVLSGSTNIGIAADSSGEGRYLRLCIIEDVCDGQFTGTDSTTGQVVVGRAKLALAAKINTSTGEADSLGFALLASKSGALVKASGESVFSPMDENDVFPGSLGGAPYFYQYNLGALDVTLEPCEKAIPLLWPAE